MKKNNEPSGFTYATPDLSISKRAVIRSIEFCCGRRAVNRVYKDFLKNNSDAASFWEDAVGSLGLQVQTLGESAGSIPDKGGVLIVANHPFGVVDGAAIAWLVKQVRSDFKVVAWDLFQHPRNAEDYLLPMDLEENSLKARKQNVRLRREAVEYLRSGGCVILFPAGMVEMSPSPLSAPQESPWTNFMSRLAVQAKVPVLPVFVDGHNSRVFHFVSHFSVTLRLAMYFHEIRRMLGAPVTLTIGKQLSPYRLSLFNNDDEITRFIRDQTLSLMEQLDENQSAQIHDTDQVVNSL